MANTPAILHQSLTQERYTPPEIAQALHEFYTGGFVDFASSELANKVIMARAFYTKEDNTLSPETDPTFGSGEPLNGFCNPPGGKFKNRSIQKLFWIRLLEAYLKGEIRSLVFLCFNLNSGPALCPSMLLYRRIYTTIEATSPCVQSSGRIRFLSSRHDLLALFDEIDLDSLPKKRREAICKKIAAIHKLPVAVPGTDLVQETSPTNPGTLIFLPPHQDTFHWNEMFVKTFRQFGSYSPGSQYG